MKITRQREIYVKRERRITINCADAPSVRFCAACQSDSRFVTVDEAAILRRTTSRQIFRLTEAREIHSEETADGLLIVCLASLASSNAIPAHLE